MAEPTAYLDSAGNIIETASLMDYGTGSDFNLDALDASLDELLNSKQFNIDRAAELKRQELYRKTGKPLQYDSDGSLETDSDLEIRAKEGLNAISSAADWILESTENIVDVGQGDWLNNAKVDAVIKGKDVNMSNKDIIAARNTNLQSLIDEYNNAEYDPNADKAIYTLRKFDGYNADGTPKYLYKHGLAEVSAADRYRNQWVADGFEIVDEKRFAGAEKWENTLHALDESLAERALDYGGVKDANGNWTSTDKASGVNFGAGYTELYNRNLLGMDDPTRQEFARNKAVSEQLMKQRDATRIAGSDWRDAIQAGALKLGIGGLDTALDILTPGGDNTFLNEYNNQEWIDKKVGFDRRESTQALTESVHQLKNGDYIGGAITALSNPDVAAESLPMMIAMFAPIPGTRVAGAAKIMKAIDAAKKAGKSAKEIAQLEKYAFFGDKVGLGPKAFKFYNKYKDAPQYLKTAEMLRKNAGFLGVDASLTNDILNERIQNKIAAGEDGEVGLDEVLGVFGTNTALLMLDKLAFKDIIGLKSTKGPAGKVIKNYLRDSFKFADSAGKKEILKSIFAKAGHVVQSMGEEAGQEYLQTWGEILGAKVGVDGQSISDVFSDEESQDEALMGLAGGLGAGGQIAGITTGLGLGSALTKRGIDYINMDKDEKVIRNAQKVDDIINDTTKIQGSSLENVLVNEIMTDGANLKDFSVDDSKSVSKFINKMVDSFGDKLDDNGKQILQKEFTKSALTKAMQYAKAEAAKGNMQPMKNVLRAMKNVNEDKDINFNISDITKGKTDTIAEKFSEVLASDDKIDIKDFDNVRYQNDADYKQSIDEAVHQKKVQKIQEIIDDIEIAKQEAAVSRQGAMLDFGNGQPGSEIDDALFASESDIQTLDKLKELVQKYRDNGYQKDYGDVVNEIKKFGFIEEDIINGKRRIKIKPSMNKYDRELYKQFINPDQIGNVLSESAQESQGATLPAFVKWSKSRWEKLLPTKATKKKPSKPSNRTVNNIMYMAAENEWFKQKAKDLRSLLNMHTVGEEGFTKSKKDAIEAELKSVEANIAKAEQLMGLHKSRIESFVKDELGLDGLDLNNPEHVKILSGILTSMHSSKFEPGSFGDMQLNTITGQNGKKYTGKGSLTHKIYQLQQVGLKPNKNFGKDVEMVVNGEPETISGYTAKTSSADNINRTFENLYGMYTSQKSLQRVAKEKGLTDKQHIALTNLKNAIKNIRKHLKNNGFNDKGIDDVLLAMHQQKTGTTEQTTQKTKKEPFKKKYQKSKADETYAETTGEVLDYKNESGDNPETTFEKQTYPEPVVTQEEEANTTILELDNIITEIQNSQIDITDEQINNFIDTVKSVLATVEDINKKELAGKIDAVVANITTSIGKDIDTLHKLQNEINDTKKSKLENEKAMTDEYSKANKSGILSGIIDSMKNVIKSIKQKIIRLGKKAFGLITNIENKKKLRSGLKNIQMYLNNDNSSKSIISELDDIQKIYNDANKLRSVFSRVTKKAQDKAASLFGSTLETTKEEYPEVYRLYQKINSKLGRFKRKDGPYVYGANKPTYGDILSEQYNRDKEEYLQGVNKHENFQDFMTFKEWLKRRGNKSDMKKYGDMTEEDIAEYERRTQENAAYEKEMNTQEEQTDNTEINPMDYMYGFDTGFAQEDDIQSTISDSAQKKKAQKKVEEGYNSIKDKNKKIQNNEDC